MGKPAVLFMTNSELGQATVSLAVAHEFLRRSSYDVHIASFPALETAVLQLNARATSSLGQENYSLASFHPIPGESMIERVTGGSPQWALFGTHQVGFFGALKAHRTLPGLYAPWTGEEYMEIYRSCLGIIHEIKPAMIAVDPLFAQAVDACRKSDYPYVVLSPNTLKDHVLQPKLGNLWKFPIMCSGYRFPLPWWQVLPNAFLTIRLGISWSKSVELNKIDEHRHSNGLTGPYPTLITAADDHTPVLVPSRPEIDFPSFVPKNFTLCGPILRPCEPIAQESPELETWISQRPTILINMGSLVRFECPQVQQMAHGIRLLLDHKPDLQVLWKLRHDPTTTENDVGQALSCLEHIIDIGRVQIMSWLPVEPICILQSRQVVGIVHHGGSNSYHEAVKAGVPQIVLPVWFDTYDFAARVEWLGIGVWASQRSAPAINGVELGNALIRVLASTESEVFQQKAKLIASQLGLKEGREIACEKMVEVIEAQM